MSFFFSDLHLKACLEQSNGSQMQINLSKLSSKHPFVENEWKTSQNLNTDDTEKVLTWDG